MAPFDWLTKRATTPTIVPAAIGPVNHPGNNEFLEIPARTSLARRALMRP